MPELEQFLEEMRSEGSADSSGRFDLDIKKARQKLGHFFTAKEGDFLLYWIRFGVFYGAPDLDLDIAAEAIRLGFAGEGPAAEEVRTLFGQSSLGLRYLQMAVLGAQQQGYATVELLTPHWCARYHADEQSLEFDSHGPSGRIQLHAHRAVPKRERLRHRLGKLLGRSQAVITPADLPYLTTPLRVRGKLLLPSGFTGRQHLLFTTSGDLAQRCAASTEVYQLDPHNLPGLGTLSVVLSRDRQRNLSNSLAEPPQLLIVVHGVHYAGPRNFGLPPESRVVVEAPQARLDLSLLQLSSEANGEETLSRIPSVVLDMLTVSLVNFPNLVERLPLAVVDWVTDQLCRQGRRHEAHNLCQASLHRLGASAPHPLETAILERASLLSGILLRSPDESLLQKAESAWLSLYSRESMWKAGDGSFQGFWRNLVECGAVHLPPEEAWLASACLELSGSAAIAFYRETVRRSVSPDKLNPELLEHLWSADQSSLARNFLIARHLAKQRPLQLLATEASICARRLLGTVSDAPPLLLGEMEKRHIYDLVERLCKLGLEAINEQGSRLKESAQWIDSAVLEDQVRRDHMRVEHNSTPLRFEFALQLAIAQRLLGRRQESIDSLLALVQLLRRAKSRGEEQYSDAESARLRRELLHHDLEDEAREVPRFAGHSGEFEARKA